MTFLAAEVFFGKHCSFTHVSEGSFLVDLLLEVGEDGRIDHALLSCHDVNVELKLAQQDGSLGRIVNGHQMLSRLQQLSSDQIINESLCSGARGLQ